MQEFNGKIAVITGAGAGIGRELARQLAAENCHLALCDLSAESLSETKRLCEAAGQPDLVVSTHICDVADESQMLAFVEEVKAAHVTETINLLFNNAGIGVGNSFINSTREDWERCFNICWYGVYYGTRAFLPMLLASDAGHIVNTSSVCGFWAAAGQTSNTAYAAAKFAVKGFSEGLVVDLRMNAPHIKVSVVMPGYVGTDIFKNSGKVAGFGDPEATGKFDTEGHRRQWKHMGLPVDEMTDEQLQAFLIKAGHDFAENAPTTSAEAAAIILNGVRNERWRILVGEDAHLLDQMVRENPEQAYDPKFIQKALETKAWSAV